MTTKGGQIRLSQKGSIREQIQHVIISLEKCYKRQKT